MYTVSFLFCGTTGRRLQHSDSFCLGDHQVYKFPFCIANTSRYRVVTFWLDRDTDDVTSGQSFHEFLAWAEEGRSTRGDAKGFAFGTWAA